MPGRIALLLDPVSADDPRTDFTGTFRRVEPDAPVFGLWDVSGWRGDGVFESVGVVDRHVGELVAHVTRLARSARLSDLAEPHPLQWRQAAQAVAAACGPGQWAMKLVLWRPGAGDRPVAWVVAAAAPDHARVRRDGVRVITLDGGMDSGAASRASWLLRGAKTFSYAVNMAAVREARRRGADEVVFVSSDGVVLEGATSSVVLRIEGRFVTPDAGAGVLPGTTQAALFAHLRAQGADAESRTVLAGELVRADAAWLVSSVRLAVPVIAIDGRPLPLDRALTSSFNRFLLAPASDPSAPSL